MNCYTKYLQIREQKPQAWTESLPQWTTRQHNVDTWIHVSTDNITDITDNITRMLSYYMDEHYPAGPEIQ